MSATPLNPDIRKEQTAWVAPATVEYYKTHRKAQADLYPSERFFLPALLPKIKTVLDVGCALGGFSSIMKSFNKGLDYTGVDINADFVAHASQEHPESRFEVSDGVSLPFTPSSFDLVHCTGILHLNSRYQDMVQAMWQQTRRYLLCDFRLTWQATTIGTFRVDFAGKNESGQVLPYNVVNVSELMHFFLSLSPAAGSIQGRGYVHAVSPTAQVAAEEVIMAVFLLEKNSKNPPLIDIKFHE